MNQNWPNDCRVGCKFISNLFELIVIDADLEEKLEQFEKAFERDEIVDLYIAENIFKVYFFVKKNILKIIFH
jgi:hypothetical protein